MNADTRKTPPLPDRRPLQRPAESVFIYAAPHGFVRVRRRTAAKLLREAGDRLVVRRVEALGLVYVEPHPF